MGFLHAVFAKIRQAKRQCLLDHLNGKPFGHTNQGTGSRIASAARARRLDARARSVKPVSEFVEGRHAGYSNTGEQAASTGGIDGEYVLQQLQQEAQIRQGELAVMIQVGSRQIDGDAAEQHGEHDSDIGECDLPIAIQITAHRTSGECGRVGGRIRRR